jgi:hypothetical protein
MQIRSLIHSVSLWALMQAIVGAAAAQTVIVFDPANSRGTLPRSINEGGEITGGFIDATAGTERGFVRDANGVITVFDAPNSGTTTGTRPHSINAAGEITGHHLDLTTGKRRGFVRKPPDGLGPVVSGVLVNSNSVEINTPTTLIATVDASTTGGSDIASAEYAIDGAPGVAMAASDATFDEVDEEVTAVIPGQQTGVYEICVNGTDSAGNTGADECILLPVYDPQGGFVTGGGWVDSPDSADLENGASGKAIFGFVSKYLPGQSTPDGNLQFRFKDGDINFHSTNMDWLVVTGEPRAMFRGDGSLNGASTCKFEVDAWDESSGGEDEDAFGLKIYACGPGNADRYHLPATTLGGGSIKIHQN